MSFSETKVQNFYAPLSSGYDRMMDAEKRIPQAKKFLELLKKRKDFHTVVDAGCGSGHFAIAAANLGCQTLGIDLSNDMLDIARRTADARSTKVQWRQGSLTQTDTLVNEPADLLLCMGNTLPHVLEHEEFKKTCRAFFNAVRPGGRAVIHLLNYEQLMAARERIVDIDRNGNLEFVRFYDYWAPNLVNFNLLTIDWSETPPKHTLNSVELHPYRLQELRDAMLEAGFAACFPCGDLQLNPFHPHHSTVLVLIAMKS